MKNIKLKDKDFFRSGTKYSKLMKKTILNNQLACLKRCDELLKQMEKKGET